MTVKEKKSHQRTIRMTERVKFILEEWEGNGMNEKFENLVLYCNQEVPFIQKEVLTLEKKKQKLQKEITKLENIQDDLDTLKRYIQLSVSSMKKYDDE